MSALPDIPPEIWAAGDRNPVALAPTAVWARPGRTRVAQPGQKMTKRGLDIVIASALLLLLLPLLLIIALLVRTSSQGPVLYRQVRVGKHGRMIVIHKFRSMYLDADRARVLLLERNDVAGGNLFKMRRDPRVTYIGRWLRKFSLDELPQLVNVVTGTMSLVGPRPALPDEVAGYAPAVRARLEVLPGLTGLWQVSGRSDLGWAESVALDLRYVQGWTLWLDLKILARTIPAVLFAKGAY